MRVVRLLASEGDHVWIVHRAGDKWGVVLS
jgi:hypothetical protein